jgi:type IV pilus assembly protein PilY1
MAFQKKHSHFLALMTALGLMTGVGFAVAGTLNLSTVPLSTATSVDPNVFFELDDSGSMDFEIMTQKFWTWQAYNSDESLIGNSGTQSSNGGSYEDDGYWTSNYKKTSSHGTSYPSNTYYYIFDASDNLNYGSGCSGVEVIPCGALTYTTNLPYELDWRILSSSLNTIYYDPSATYSPWVGPCMTSGTYCANASFTAARSNPRQGTTGYSVTRDLTGFVYEVWVDDKGFNAADGRPKRGSNVNVTPTPNGIVDLWDTHIQYTVYGDHVDIATTTYAPDQNGMNPTTTTATISGSMTDPYGHTVAQIQQNVANWYQYYRRRALTAKAAISAVIDENPSFRFGLSVINNSSTLFKQVPAASATDYSSDNLTLLTNLYSYAWTASGTPLRAGLNNVGQYYAGKLSGKTNPIINACQKCFTILMTDGYWNGSFSSTTIKDVDGDGISQTLADVARYYYITDLSTYPNNVVPDAVDSATWQHMVTYTVAFGVQGNLVDTDGDGWPNPPLTESGNWGNPQSCSDCPPMIDDLWHAAYDSKGTYISAKNPTDVVTALRKALQDISNRVSSLAAVSLNSGSISSLSKLYQAKFNSYTWEGFLEAKNVTGGAVGTVAWEAGSLLPSATSRVILTNNGSGGVPFEWSSLSSSEQTALNTNSSGSADGLGSLRLNYLRGDGSKELVNGGTFRNRQTTKLGDIINSAPQYVSNEDFGYPDNMESASYSSFVASKASRTPMVYVGANDGMLHGFNGLTGVEKIAYVPMPVYSNLSKLTSTTYSHRYFVDGTPTIGDAFYGGAWHSILVGGLRGGGQGIYALDVTDPSQFTESNASSLVMWEFTDANDADLGYTFSRPNIVKMADGTWAAVFGNGYNNTESDGHASSTGEAVLYIVNVQTGALIRKITTGVGSSQDPTGASRPNGLATVTPVDVNQDGITDYIYAGDLFGNLWKFDVTSTSSGSWGVAFNSSGVPAPLFKACGGNTCNGSNTQAITTRVTVGYGPNRIGYMVYFGTGKYLESTDVNDLSTQSLYGIWDKNDGTTTVSGRSVLLQQTILYEGTYTLQDGTSAGQPIRVTSNNDYSTYPPTQLGWYLDLTSPVSGAEGERLINQPTLRNGRIIFTTIIPSSNSCSGGGDSWLMELNALNGSQLSESPFDLNKDGNFDSKEYVQVTIDGKVVWVPVSGVKYTELLTTPAIGSQSGTPSKETKYMSGSSGSVNTIDENPGANGSGRDSWRQIK